MDLRLLLVGLVMFMVGQLIHLVTMHLIMHATRSKVSNETDSL